jgi:hypothetical protein
VIYRTLLDGDFEKLSPVLRAFHSSTGTTYATGTATVQHHNVLLAKLVGFPSAGEDLPIRVEVVATEDEETWTRWFGGEMRRSVQRVADGLLIESMGKARIDFRVRVCEGEMQIESQHARLLGVPVPVRIVAMERECDSGWQFDVKVAGIGSYSGTMNIQR